MQNNNNLTRSVAELRKAFNQVDEQILGLLSDRRLLSQEVATAKTVEGVALRDSERENSILRDVTVKGRTYGLDEGYVSHIFRSVIEDSLKTQVSHLQSRLNGQMFNQPLRVGFFGSKNSFCYLAAQKFFGSGNGELSYAGTKRIDLLISLVERGEVDFAVLPLENSVSGGNNETYQNLLTSNVKIVGEECFKIQYCLVATNPIELKDIKVIISHPHAVTQCSHFLAGLQGNSYQYETDTASAVESLKRSNDNSSVAIASEEAATQFGLEIIRRDISNYEESFTRFIVVSLHSLVIEPLIPCKTSLVLTVPNSSEALFNVLAILKEGNIELEKLESRAKINEMTYYIDLIGNVSDTAVSVALTKLKDIATFIKTLGSYPKSSYKVDTDHVIQPRIDYQISQPSTKLEPPITEPIVDITEKPSKSEYKLASRKNKAQDTIIHVRGVDIGSSDFVVIAGPCAVESEEQMNECASIVKESGALILRGGCFKPRTSPYSFQGLGYQGLSILYKVGQHFNLPIITEVLSEENLSEVAKYADILQIGARNMQNFSLLKAVGQVNRPIMLKRGLMASLDELLLAAEYILSQGNQQVFLCERGIRTFEPATRSTLDLSAIPILKSRTHLPVFVDPSHAVGDRTLVPPMALAAKAAGAHGIMIEFHPEPEKALSDGPQSLYPDQFLKLMKEL